MRRRTVRAIPLVGLAIVLIGALVWWRPFLTEERAVVTSTPAPVGVFVTSTIDLKRGSQACVGPVALDRATGKAQMGFASATGTAQLVLEASAPGYRYRREVRLDVSPRGTPVALDIASPPRDLIGTLCVTNAARAPLSVIGTTEALSFGPAKTSVDGVAIGDRSMALNLLEARPRSILSRLGTIVHRASDFTGGLVPFWLSWLLVVGLVVGTPVAIFVGFAATLRSSPE
jgi:hypothetical protein